MKWITVQGQDREGKGLHYLIHGAHDLQEGERVLVFPSADRQIPYAAAKGLAIEPGTRVVAVPHTKMPWSRITTSIFANDALPPTANFEADATLGYQPFEVRFTDLSYANPPAIAWHWDFGDGGTSEEQHPTHIYQGLGWFTVTLTVTNGLGSDYLRKEALIFSDVDHPVDLTVIRTGPSTAAIYWEPGANNTQVVIARRHDFYPPHPNNAVRVYQGAAGGFPATDSGLQEGKEYFYRIWGIRGGVLSEGYRSENIPEWAGQSSPVFVTGPWHLPVPQVGQIHTYGPFSYHWNGLGRVYISSSPSSPSSVEVDNFLKVDTAYGSTGELELWQHPQVVNITSILRPGYNAVTITIIDELYTSDDSVGALTPIYIMQAP